MKPTNPLTHCLVGQTPPALGSAFSNDAVSEKSVRPIWRGSLVFPWLLLVCFVLGFQAQSLHGAEVVATGIIQPFFDARLGVSASGVVMTRNFKEGDRVKAGDVLLELDSAMERLEVERRRVVRNQKRNVFETTKKLFGTTKGVSKEEMEAAEMEFNVAAVEHDMALEALRRKQVVTPHAAEIVEIHIEVGEACDEFQPVIRVVDATRCYFVTNLEPGQRNRFKKDQKVKLDVDVGDGRAVVEGKVDFLSPVVDPASGLTVLKILIDNQDGRIRPGLTGVVLSHNQG